MGGISDVDLENGPVEEPEGKRARGKDKRTNDEEGETRGRKEPQPVPLSLSLQPSTKQIRSREEMWGLMVQ